MKAVINIGCSLFIFLAMYRVRLIIPAFSLIALLFMLGCKGEQMCDVSDAEITECHAVAGYTWNYNTCQCEED